MMGSINTSPQAALDSLVAFARLVEDVKDPAKIAAAIKEIGEARAALDVRMGQIAEAEKRAIARFSETKVAVLAATQEREEAAEESRLAGLQSRAAQEDSRTAQGLLKKAADAQASIDSANALLDARDRAVVIKEAKATAALAQAQARAAGIIAEAERVEAQAVAMRKDLEDRLAKMKALVS